ncbi:hypothetical protein ACGFNU_44310 [Spirillospora sp. NPDC048911]|uniref:hypothetical protein n=1 Tax=Spirillospora sp. NPDC048911 TaxID=3364527 RepID=UPI003720EBAC
MERQPNQRLADLIDEVGISHLALAKRICRVAEEWRESVRPAHTQVGRWIAGQQPRGATPALIAEALSRKLGRRVTLADIGMAGTTTSPEVGLSFSHTTEDLIETVIELWTADLQRRKFLLGSVDVTALTHPAFEWLLASAASPRAREGRRQVGMSDVEAIRSTSAMFAGLDNRFGGAHSRTAAVQYLSDQVTPLLSGSYSSSIAAALFSAVAEFNLSVAWMAYDSGLHGLSRRYFLQALALAHHAGDRLFGASTLSAMSHQANYLGEHRHALNLARAASHGIQHHDEPLLEAQFAAMQARAAAAMPNAADECLDALGIAEAAWERHRAGEEPEWISYFDESELADEFAHCFRDLGQPARSHEYATQCLAAGDEEYARSRTFSRIVLATSLLDQGEVEEACTVATRTLPRVQETASVRCTTYLRDFHVRARPYATHPAVTAFTEQARPLLEGHHLPGHRPTSPSDQ